jgi:drug/metabolite transporter (DMT)-like permease
MPVSDPMSDNSDSSQTPSAPAPAIAPDADPAPALLTSRRLRALVRPDMTGYFFAAAGAFLFSTKAIIIKLAYADAIDAETLLALRMGLSLPFYFVIGAMAWRDRKALGTLPRWGTIWRAAFIGVLGYWFASYTDFLGLEYISAQFERLILFTYPLFVVLFGALFFGQRIRARALLATLVSYAGLAVIFLQKANSGNSAIEIGAALVLSAAIAFAFYQLLAKDPIAIMGPRLFTCIAMSGAAVGAFIQFFLTHNASALVVNATGFGYAFLLAIGATVLPSFFLNAALSRISAHANATISTLSPVITIGLAVVILGEQLSLIEGVGAVLVLLGVGWFTLASRPK